MENAFDALADKVEQSRSCILVDIPLCMAVYNVFTVLKIIVYFLEKSKLFAREPPVGVIARGGMRHFYLHFSLKTL